ncbi:MAG: hypothetical protein CMJ54_11970, partial [Planctomycetaceae bacterium]|nr:hypothetical protein [Planctomycetaceae bacterium]
CVGCKASIEQDECIIRPLEGDDAIESTVAPWFDQSRGIFKRTIFTAGWAMVRPGDLARGIPRDSSFNAGIVFLLLVNLLALVVGFLPIIFVVMAVPLWTQGLNAVNAPGIGLATGMVSLFGGFTIVSSVVSILLIAVVGHGVLRLTGPVQDGLGRTVTLACFGSGPVLIVAIPCLGPYCGSQVSGIWAIVSTILLLAAGQRVGGGRATLAVLAVPVLAILAFVGVIVFNAAVSANTMNARLAGNAVPPVTATRTAGLSGVVEDDVEKIVRGLLPELTSMAAPMLGDDLLDQLSADDLEDLFQTPSGTKTTFASQAGCINWFAGDLWLTALPGTAPNGGASKAVIGLRADPAQPERISMIVIDGEDGSSRQVAAEDFHATLISQLDYLGVVVKDPVSPELVDRWLTGMFPPAKFGLDRPPGELSEDVADDPDVAPDQP